MQLKHIHLQKNRRLWVVPTVSVRYPKLPSRHHRSAPCCDGTHPHPPLPAAKKYFYPSIPGHRRRTSIWFFRGLSFSTAERSRWYRLVLWAFIVSCLSLWVWLCLVHSFCASLLSVPPSLSFISCDGLFQSRPKLQTVDLLDFVI